MYVHNYLRIPKKKARRKPIKNTATTTTITPQARSALVERGPKAAAMVVNSVVVIDLLSVFLSISAGIVCVNIPPPPRG